MLFTRWDDFDRSVELVEDLRRRMDRLFEDYNGGGQTHAIRGVGHWPRVHFADNGTSFVLTAEVPGLSEKDIKLTVNQDVLTIEGERKVEVPKGYSVHRQERIPVRFARGFSLPCRVDVEKVQAVVKDGVLTVALAKAPEAQPRQITVRAQ